MILETKDLPLDSSTWKKIRSHPMFHGIDDNTLIKIIPNFRKIMLRPGDLLIVEGESTSRELFLILKGNLEVVKKTDSQHDHQAVSSDDFGQFIIAKLMNGDLIGELSFIKGIKRSASIKCLTETEVLALDPQSNTTIARHYPGAAAKLMLNLAGYVASQLQKTSINAVRALETELYNSKLNAKANLFFSYVIGLLCIYNLTISRIAQLSIDANRASIISAIIIVSFCLGLILMIHQSKLPIHIMGLTLANWKPAVKESLIWSGGIVLSMIIIKWILISQVIRYQNLPLFDFDMAQRSLGINFVLYGLHSPIQEFVARGVLQGSLQHFFSGRNVTLRAIIVSNALFSATHVHLMNGLLGVIVFIPGLFWGWLYARNNNLIGVSISHLIIGWTGLFFLNLESLFR